MALHKIEQKIIEHMRHGEATIPDITKGTGLDADQVRRGVQWLLGKGAIHASTKPRRIYALGKAGARAITEGLPERRLLDLLRDNADIMRSMGAEAGPAIGVCVRHGWIRMEGGTPALVEYPHTIQGELILDAIQKGEDADVSYFDGRPDYIIQKSTPAAYSLKDPHITHTQRMDLEADAARTYIARTHPIHDTISEVREAFVSLGFDEVVGSMVQPSFWNFDALFTPQDHPAREMQDTFYLDAHTDVDAPRHMVQSVSDAHTSGWGGSWDESQAARAVLRTHTTCVTIRHLAYNPGEARLFSLGRVFRNEKPSYKHLAEFHQVEGVVAEGGMSLRDLMGIQRQFYAMMGMEKVRFWPTYFPYTEPSLQSMVYNKEVGKWVELFGMGIFRPEVTGPLGISGPVLAWGGGIERIAMIMHGVQDVRTFYNNDLGWLRGLPLCR